MNIYQLIRLGFAPVAFLPLRSRIWAANLKRFHSWLEFRLFDNAGFSNDCCPASAQLKIFWSESSTPLQLFRLFEAHLEVYIWMSASEGHCGAMTFCCRRATCPFPICFTCTDLPCCDTMRLGEGVTAASLASHHPAVAGPSERAVQFKQTWLCEGLKGHKV